MRLRILDAAAQAILSGKADLLSIARLRREVGGSKQTLYNHFGDRDALLRAAFETALDRAMPPVGEWLPPAGPLRTRLVTFAQAYLAWAGRPAAAAARGGLARVASELNLGSVAEAAIQASWAPVRACLAAAAGAPPPDAASVDLAARVMRVVLEADLVEALMFGPRPSRSPGESLRMAEAAVDTAVALASNRQLHDARTAVR